jgi:hypothetical protein
MGSTPEQIPQMLGEWAKGWMNLSHPNILPFIGVHITCSYISLVYDEHDGGIFEYMSSHPTVSRMSLVCKFLLS